MTWSNHPFLIIRSSWSKWVRHQKWCNEWDFTLDPLRYCSEKIKMLMKNVQFWNKIQHRQDFLSYMHVHYTTIFVLNRYIGWHSKQYQFNHFHPLLIIFSRSKRVRTWKLCNWSDFLHINQFLVRESNEHGITILELSFLIHSSSSVLRDQNKARLRKISVILMI